MVGCKYYFVGMRQSEKLAVGGNQTQSPWLELPSLVTRLLVLTTLEKPSPTPVFINGLLHSPCHKRRGSLRMSLPYKCVCMCVYVCVGLGGGGGGFKE